LSAEHRPQAFDFSSKYLHNRRCIDMGRYFEPGFCFGLPASIDYIRPTRQV
jgi:hypothetical protein